MPPTSRTSAAIAIAAATFATLTCDAANAGFIVSVGNASAAAGSTGSPGGATNFVDVFLSAETTPESLDGFNVELSVPAGSGITFTGAVTEGTEGPVPSTSTYVFAGVGEGLLVTSPASSASSQFNDLVRFGLPAVAIGLAEVRLLGRVYFSVASGAAPGSVVPVTVVAAGTDFTRIEGGNVVFVPKQVVAGSVTVTPAAVPEPSSLFLLSACLAAGSSLAWRRRRGPGESMPTP